MNTKYYHKTYLIFKIFDEFAGLNTAEMLDGETNEWRSIAPMNTRRSSVGVAVLSGIICW